ncbi:MAG: hypothetical protein AUK47_12615 [Deltaproteobacteria bacterium CG2_30_63_29]|nr:MAG: hypothetical protein AUK47_12615 [Deltaproteobacteria bacterium CG2_30_63_29]PJB35610.1 MAG: hypothetical protein CO108_25205 [Deltaproteobacteria bacterium CG_4_9_14_3_um_filter_63_12]
MQPVYIRSAELGAPLTDKPKETLREVMLSAATKAIAKGGLVAQDIDAIFVGAMGGFAHERFMGALPLWIANQLDLRSADVAPMMIGSSETGAWTLRSAFQALRREGHWDNVLLITGEQMNPLLDQQAVSAAEREAERRERNATISQIVDEADREYGLNMLRIADLFMDLVADSHHWSRADLTELLLPFIALEKYRRVRRYPFGQFYRNHLDNFEGYLSRPAVTHYYRLDDVTPTSSGAVAVVLSRVPRADAVVEILGMGQGYVPASLTKRYGAARTFQSIRAAYKQACNDAGLPLSWLLDCDFAIIHDAFPSIEYAFLAELGLSREAIVERLVSGWSNPFGGLKGCGHALGASGLLQVAKSFQTFTNDPTYIDPSVPRGPSPFPALVKGPPFETCFTTSVGGALANVVVTLLRKGCKELDLARWTRTSSAPPDAARERVPTIEPNRGMRVLARTRLRHTPAFGDDETPLTQHVKDPWVFLLENSLSDGTGCKALGYSSMLFAVGSLVRCECTQFEGVDYWRVAQLLPESPSQPTSVASRSSIEFTIDLERRFQQCGYRRAPLRFLETPHELLGRYLIYAEVADPTKEPAEVARMTQQLGRWQPGHKVQIHRLKKDGPQLEALKLWSALATVQEISLPAVMELNLSLGAPVLVRDYIDGIPLYEASRRSAPGDTVRRWAADLINALDALQRAGLNHGGLTSTAVLAESRGRAIINALPVPGERRQRDASGLACVLVSLLEGKAVADESQARQLASDRSERLGPRAMLLELVRACLSQEGETLNLGPLRAILADV